MLDNFLLQSIQQQRLKEFLQQFVSMCVDGGFEQDKCSRSRYERGGMEGGKRRGRGEGGEGGRHMGDIWPGQVNIPKLPPGFKVQLYFHSKIDCHNYGCWLCFLREVLCLHCVHSPWPMTLWWIGECVLRCLLGVLIASPLQLLFSSIGVILFSLQLKWCHCHTYPYHGVIVIATISLIVGLLN